MPTLLFILSHWSWMLSISIFHLPMWKRILSNSCSRIWQSIFASSYKFFPQIANSCLSFIKVFNFSNYFSSFTWFSFINSLASISNLTSTNVISTSVPSMLSRTWGSYLKKNQQLVFKNQIDGKINLNTLCEFNCVHYFLGMMIKEKLEEENTLELIGCGICSREILGLEVHCAFLWIWKVMLQLLSYCFAPSKIQPFHHPYYTTNPPTFPLTFVSFSPIVSSMFCWFFASHAWNPSMFPHP